MAMQLMNRTRMIFEKKTELKYLRASSIWFLWTLIVMKRPAIELRAIVIICA